MQNWVDFAAIKRSIALAPLLRHYQVKLHRSGRDQYRGCCPIHGGDSRDAFHANLTKNVFQCFACGGIDGCNHCGLSQRFGSISQSTH